MARTFLDNAIELTNSGNKIYKVYFNDVTRAVEADFVKIFDVFNGDLAAYPQTYTIGQQMHDQCVGTDRYQVYKSQVLPFGALVETRNSSSCLAVYVFNALYRFNDAGGDAMGDVAADVCPFAGSAYLYYEGALEVGKALFSDYGLTTPLPYSGTGWFRIGTSAYQINTDSELITIEPAYCEIIAPLPEPEPLPDLDFGPFFHLPQATSLRFVKDGAVATKTHDNTLFAGLITPGVIPKPFDQVVKQGETVTIQWGSSYATNELKLYNAATGALLATLAGSKVQENLNQEITVPGFAVSDPSIVGVQIWFPNHPFPDFAIAGNKINIAGDQVNGQYNVIAVQDGKGLAKGNRVLIADFVIDTPSSTPVEVTGKYNAEPYEVYESELTLATAGRYYAKITCTDGVFDDVSATSEPILVTADVDEYLELAYTNEEDAYGCYYGNAITHRLWVHSRIYKITPGGEKTINRETSARLVKLDEYITKVMTWECFRMPPYLITQVSIGLSHDETRVNSILVQTQDPPEVEWYLPSPFGTLTVELEDVEYTERNADGGSIDSSDSYLLINTGNRLLINP